MADKRPAADWERIEANFRAGVMTLREIAAADGNVTEGAIRKRAKRDGWVRNLSAKIAARAEELVRKQEVRKPSTQMTEVSERETIEANAHAIVEVKMRERGGLRSLLTERAEMLKELIAQRDALIPLERATEILAELEDKPVDANELRKVYQRAVGLGGRASILKALAEIDAKLIPLERQAWGLDAEPAKASELESLDDDELDRRIDARLGNAQRAA